MSQNLINELAEKIDQFLRHQGESNDNLSEVAKESLTVASECIEQAFNIQRKPPSNELLNIYQSHKDGANSQQSASAAGFQQTQANPAAFIQNLASTILSQATSGPSAPPPPTGTATPSPNAPPTAPKKVRKNPTEAEKLAAESYKNQGNDFMKMDKYKEAHECYTTAIGLDDNNAIYYSNRAAVSSKLGDHQAALRDCQEAVEIDPNYSKAYGRMGLAYASMDDHQRAKDAYIKAVELDPNNESYRNNLKIAEEKLASDGAGGGTQNNMMTMLRSMMSNPEIMSLAMRSLQDPRIQSMFNLGGAGGPGGPGGPTSGST